MSGVRGEARWRIAPNCAQRIARRIARRELRGTSSSFEKMSWANTERAGATSCQLGCGLPRQRFESVHVALRSIDIFEFGLSCSSSGWSAPCVSTRSRHSGESPAMLPSAHTACSRTSSFGLSSSWTKIGTAPLAMTTRVCSDVPDAMFVSAHALSNCSIGLSPHCRNCTKRGTTPAAITSSIGGERSMLSSLRNCVTAGSCAFGSSEWTPSTSCCGLASCHAWLPTVGCSGPGMPPGGVAPAPGVVRMSRRFCSCSCFLSLRIEIVVSSLPLRNSSPSIFAYRDDPCRDDGSPSRGMVAGAADDGGGR